MSLHVFANFVTPFGTAANNRAETEGNITTLQKLLWHGRDALAPFSAEAIRFALRRRLAGPRRRHEPHLGRGRAEQRLGGLDVQGLGDGQGRRRSSTTTCSAT